MRILLVDASPTIRNLQKNVLRELGHTDIIEANGGMQALAVFAEQTPDLAIVDGNLPNMDGITLVRKIRESGNQIPLIMCTTETEKTKVMEAIEAGVNNYIIKPFTVEALGRRIHQTLEKAAASAS